MTIFLSIALIKWNTFRAKVTITTSHSDSAVFTFYKEYINITMYRFRQVKYINAQFTDIYNQFRNLKVLTFFTFFLSLYYHVFIVFVVIMYFICILFFNTEIDDSRNCLYMEPAYQTPGTLKWGNCHSSYRSVCENDSLPGR